ncbi:MAG: DUF922 domain-containing protein [Caldimonas sp.]
MKVERKLVKNSATYKVHGKTLQAAKTALGPTCWGRFKPMAGKTKYTVDKKSKKVLSVELVVGHTIEMPVWSEYKAAPEPCRAEWDRMWKALEKHEKDHALVYLESIVMLENKLDDVEPGTMDPAGVDKLVAAAMVQMESAQDAFESATDRGRNRGVVLNPPGECL